MQNIIFANIIIPTQYFEKTLSFYRDILGFEIFHQIKGEASIRACNLEMTICTIDSSTEFSPTGHGIYIRLLVDSTSQIRERLAAAGVAVQSKDYAFFFTDPNGNLIEVMGFDSDKKEQKKESLIVLIVSVVSYVTPLHLEMRQLDNYFTVIGIPEALKIEMKSLQAKMTEMFETGKNLRYEASGVEDEQNHREKIDAFRGELFALTARFYKFIDAVAQLTPTIYQQEIQGIIARMKLILDEVPMIPK